MNKTAVILTSIILCYPFNYGNCVLISEEEMDAPLKGMKRVDRSKYSEEKLHEVMMKTLVWPKRSKAAKLAMGLDYYIKKPLYAAALQIKRGENLKLPEETIEKACKAKEKASKKINTFLTATKFVPFTGMRVFKHLTNTLLEIEDLVSFLKGEETVNIDSITPSGDFHSCIKTNYGRFYGIQEEFQDVPNVGRLTCYLNDEPLTLNSIEYQDPVVIHKILEELPADTGRYDEWTPTQSILDWAKNKQQEARVITASSALNKANEIMRNMEILSISGGREK